MPLLIQEGDTKTIIYGRSIPGGLFGGMLGVMLIKRKLKIKAKMGNVIVPAVVLGISIEDWAVS